MKNLFKIHSLTYVILLSVLLCGYFNYFLIISTILVFHDLGHIFFIKIFNYQITNVIVLPFGSIINSNLKMSAKTNEVFLISIAGIMMQIFLYPVMFFLNQVFVSDLSYQIFLEYNRLILLFNLLPIIPLDGSKIVLCFLEIFLSFKKALKVLNIISVIGVIGMFIYISVYSLNSYLIIVFLAYKTYEEIINHKYIFHKFLLDRYLMIKSLKKIKYIKSLKKIHKNKYNFINNQNEEKVLKHYLGL